MTDYYTISHIKKYSGKVMCERCKTEMEIIRGVVHPLPSVVRKPQKRVLPQTSLFAEFQCPICKGLKIFRKIVVGE